MDIRCDLKGDLNAFAEKQMLIKGCKWKRSDNVSPFHQYMNLLNREVTPLPREVHFSRKLECPDDLRVGFNSLVRALIFGHNVNAYLSSNLKRAGYNDGFLNDFGLHHFHLGTGICSEGKSKGFINRTGPILIAYVTESSAYLIGIYEHSSPYLWTDQAVIEVIHNEWPYALSNFKINGIPTSQEPITPVDRKVLRSKSCNSFIEMSDGTIYAPIGGGITAASTNTNLMIDYDHFFMELKIILKELCLYINRTNCERLNYPINLTLSSIIGGFLFSDTTNNIQYFVKKIDSFNLQITQFINGSLPDYYPNTEPLKLNLITELFIENKN